MRLRALLVLSFLVAFPLMADPPARVVRLNLTDGVVSFRPAGIDEWTDATVNRPLIDGDELWTDASSRAEMHIASAAVRLGPSTSFGIVSVNDRVAQLRVTAGTASIRVRGIGEDDVWEVDTPNASISLLRPGRYRIDVAEDGGTTVVTARGGEAEVTAGGSAFPVRAGDRAEITGDGDNQSHDVNAAPAADRFDRWCSDRDRREEKLAALEHVPRDMVGYEDLDANGSWRLVADYGWVWRPTYVVAGWAPYRYGHWAWVEPWGWTWIDDAPWGFAPFHYGRWAYFESGWIWVPGRIVHPVYAPALVAFGGGGAGWHANLTVWWPLAPGEVFVPAYRVAPAYVRNINAPVVNVTRINVTNINVTNVHYRNQGVAGGVTAVSREAFVGARPVASSTVAMSMAQVTSVKAIGTTAPVAPNTTSVLGHTHAVARAAVVPPQAVVARSVIARTPPPPPPIPFRAKETVLAQNPGKPLTPDTVKELRVSGAAPTTSSVVRPLMTSTPPPKARTLKTDTTVKEQTTTTTSATTTSGPRTMHTPPRHVAATTTSATTTTAVTTTSGGTHNKTQEKKPKPKEKDKEPKKEPRKD
jgi:hypothetical protein